MRRIKAGDLVSILTPTMGTKLPSGRSGIAIEHSLEKGSTWSVLIRGKIEQLPERLLLKIKT